MSLDYISEAFKRLALLNEDAFDTSLDGLNKLSDFMEQDDVEDVVKVIDPETEETEELQDSYIGKVIINCNVCHSHIFENKEDVSIDEDGVVNGDMQCPYCGEQEGFVIVGEITEFKETSDDVKVEVEGEEVPETDSSNDSTEPEEELEESLDMNKSIKSLTEAPVVLDLPTTNGTVAEVLARHNEEIDSVGTNENAVKSIITKILRSGEVKNEKDAETAIHRINSSRGNKLWSTIATYMTGDKVIDTRRRVASECLEEDVNNVNVETDDSVVNVHAEDDGKVVVSTEPKEAVPSEDEMIAPLSDETMNELEANGEEELEAPEEEEIPVEDNEEETVDLDIDEIEEEGMDELGESYLKNVYENVKSFKTTSASTSNSKMVIEGVITFNSGAKKKTGFIFEAKDATRTGKVRFIGENVQLSRGRKSFTLTGKIENKKLLPESFTYNYRAKNSEGKSGRVYGTVSRQK